ncbi:MAG: hypothetical protein R3F02_18700 [Thiolinea sp.]
MADTKPADKPVATAANAKPVAVKFEKSWGSYNKGETAGFQSAKADWLVEKKIAVKA